MIIESTGLLSAVPFIASPHYDERPENTVIDLLVIHNISLPPGEFGHAYIRDLFMGVLEVSAHPYFESLKDVRVSAHLFISRQGHITQFVPFLKRAWHAGVSSFAGRTQCNDFSIGIEVEGTDTLPYEEAQYESLAQVTRVIMQMYPAITPDRIVGHSTIAPDRKTDPGPSFDWGYYFKKTLIE